MIARASDSQYVFINEEAFSSIIGEGGGGGGGGEEGVGAQFFHI